MNAKEYLENMIQEEINQQKYKCRYDEELLDIILNVIENENILDDINMLRRD